VSVAGTAPGHRAFSWAGNEREDVLKHVMHRTWLVGALAMLAAPAVAQTSPRAAAPLDTAVVAGGCFWGIQAVFEHVHGVVEAVSGYAGGDASTADYETVSTGRTGHAESVRIVFDPAVVSYAQLLDVFFGVAHDPTELNRQGPDVGTQYRSAIFTRSAAQRRTADSAIAALTRARVHGGTIVTVVSALDRFYPAEAYHQDYARLHPMNPYILFNDRPKVAHLKERFPQLWREEPVRVAIAESGR
jgi:peptide-methionine (S)-S-oxide reductase